MNWNARLLTAVSLLVILGSAAFSQMEGGDPAGMPGMDPAGMGAAQTGFESGSPEGAGAKKADEEALAALEAEGDEEQASLLGTWATARDIFKPGGGLLIAPPVLSSAGQDIVADSTTESVAEAGFLPVLHGVMTGSDGDKVAILETGMVREGDFRGGFTVRTIRPKSVTLSRDGKEYVLYVKE